MAPTRRKKRSKPAKPGPKEERLKIDGDWKDAAKRAIKKKRPRG